MDKENLVFQSRDQQVSTITKVCVGGNRGKGVGCGLWGGVS
jgi:hypothetical protein